ncbi:MAG: DsbA family protein [bacterium]|nr:DsbA family protein [bacterium]
MNNKLGDKFFISASIIVAGLLVASAVIYSGGFFSKNNGGEAAVDVAAEDLAGKSPFLGNPEAPVTMVEFSDYQCPFCNQFFRGSEKQIVDKYVKTGKVKFVYRNFAFLGQESQWASEAAECANEQGKFWEYHDHLFNYIWDNYYAKNVNGENVGAFSKDNLNKFAADLGLDIQKFSFCLDSGKYAGAVKKETAEGRAAGVTGTPTTFINGKAITGALPFDQFSLAIEAALGGK